MMQQPADRSADTDIYRLAFDNSPQGIVIAGEGGRILQANAAAQRILGLSLAQLQGLSNFDPHWHSVHEDGSPFPPEEHPITIARLTGREVPATVMGVRKGLGADMCWISVAAAPMFRAGDGAAQQAIATFVDITAPKRTELALLETQSLLLRAEAVARLGSWEMNLETRQIVASAGAAEIYGLSGASWTYDEIKRAALPEYRQMLDASFAQLMRDGKTDPVEYRIRRASDGALRDLRSLAEIDRARSTVFGVISDETDRKRTESLLTASEERFQAAFRRSPVIMTITELESGRYIDVNDRFCAMSGYTREEAIGKTAVELGWITPGTREAAIDMLRRTGAVSNREEHVRSRAGEERTCLMSGEVLEFGGQPCLLVIVVDITDLRRIESERATLESQVHHLKRMDSIGRLAGGVAHDMNNVLTAILTLAEIQQSESEPGSPLYSDMETIAQACLRGQSTVRGLLDFARADVSTRELIDLNALVRDEVALLARTTLQKARMSTVLEEGLPAVFGDRAALSHVLMNLCLNAVDAMPHSGSVELRTRRDGEAHVIVEVADDGVGMPRDVLDKALDPFFTTKPQGKGTGLGLSIVFGAVKAHGGTIDIRSTPGEGTTVVIRLPTASASDLNEAQ